MNPLTSIIERDTLAILDGLDAEKLTGKHLLLTGASGLMGTYFLATLRALNQKGARITVSAVMQSELPSYMNPLLEGVTILRGDITDSDFLASLPEVDVVIHAAGYGQPGRFMEDQVKTIELNTASTISLFRKLRPEGIFLFMSTSEVYSGLPNPPYREDQIGTSNTNHPRACYIEGKRCGEAIVHAMRSQGVDAKSARLSLAYGPGTKKGDARVLNSFIYRGIVEKEIRLMDGGEARRTYCYVADAVAILWHILLAGKEGVYNVGGDSRTTIGELAKHIGAYLDVPAIFPEDAANALGGAPEDVSLDMSRVLEEFGPHSFVPLKEGLARTIEWQKALYAV